MEIKTKKVVESVTFNEDEKQFMRNLANTMEEECKNHFSCETCPFDGRGYDTCEGFIDALRNFASAGRLEL